GEQDQVGAEAAAGELDQQGGAVHAEAVGHHQRTVGARARGSGAWGHGGLLSVLRQSANSKPCPWSSTRRAGTCGGCGTGSAAGGGSTRVPRMDAGKGKASQGAYSAPLTRHIATASGSMSWPYRHSETFEAC